MKPLHVSEPLTEIPLGGKSYPVRQITLEAVHRLRPYSKILAQSGGKPLAGEIALGYVATIRELIGEGHPELTDAYIYDSLTNPLCATVAKEYLRQAMLVMPFRQA